MAIKHVRAVVFVELTESFNNLVLMRSIDLFQCLLHLAFESCVLSLELSDSLVL